MTRWRFAVLAPLVLVVLAAAAILVKQPWASSEPVAFKPPFPELSSTGEPIRAVYEGRVPCERPCQVLKVSLVLYGNPSSGAAGTYWLGLVQVAVSDDRIVRNGAWTTRRGAAGAPDATVYELDVNAPAGLRRYWAVSNDVLLPLDDQTMSPRVGTGAFGYVLSRYSGTYGPRTYPE